MPPMFLTGTAAAASIAWINSIGNLGGFFGPWYVGVIKDWTGSYAGGLYGLAFLCVMSAVVCALFLHIPDPIRARAQAGRSTRRLRVSLPCTPAGFTRGCLRKRQWHRGLRRRQPEGEALLDVEPHALGIVVEIADREILADRQLEIAAAHRQITTAAIEPGRPDDGAVDQPLDVAAASG